MFGNLGKSLVVSGLLKGLILRQEGEDRDEKNSLSCRTMNEEHSRDIPS